MGNLLKLTLNDLRLIFRDKSLAIFIVLPLLNVLVVRYGLPIVIEKFAVVGDYVEIILMATSMQSALIFGFIYSMVLIDEKDKNVAKVYGVLPVSKFWFVLFRLIAPVIFSTFATFSIFFFEPFFRLPIATSLFYSLLSGLTAPIMVLFVTIMANNKLEGMTWQKLFNIPVMLPLLTFFVPAVYSYAFAVLPTYWAYRGFHNLVAGDSYVLHFLIGFCFSIGVIGLLGSRFARSHFA